MSVLSALSRLSLLFGLFRAGVFSEWICECHQFLYLHVTLTVWWEAVSLKEKSEIIIQIIFIRSATVNTVDFITSWCH